LNHLYTDIRKKRDVLAGGARRGPHAQNPQWFRLRLEIYWGHCGKGIPSEPFSNKGPWAGKPIYGSFGDRSLTMAKTMYKALAAAVLCSVVGFAGPSFAATHTKAGHMKYMSKHAVLHSIKLSDLDLMERQITAELNRAALTKATQAEATVIIPNMVASADIEKDHGD